MATTPALCATPPVSGGEPEYQTKPLPNLIATLWWFLRRFATPTEMKQRLALIIGVTLMALSGHMTLAQTRITDDEIRNILRDRVDRAKKNVGIVVGLVDEKGVRVIAYGKPSTHSTQTVNGDTVFEIGSISKVFTTLLLADMVERGEVGLDDPISKYLPASVKVPSRGGKEITLRHLAMHASGLPGMPDNFWGPASFVKWQLTCPFCRNADYVGDRYAKYSLDKMYEFLSSYQLKQDIGRNYEYSNYGNALLGQILVLRSGMDYETLVRSRISQPLRMENTRVQLTPEMQSRLAIGYNEAERRVRSWDMAAFAPAGGLRSTANDLLKFVAANLGLTPARLLSKTEKP